MEHDKLKQTLQELNHQLSEESGALPQKLDAESRLMLLELSAQVQQILQQPPLPAGHSPAEGVPVQEQPLLDSLLSVTKEFEESHPKLAETIGQLATALSRIGI